MCGTNLCRLLTFRGIGITVDSQILVAYQINVVISQKQTKREGLFNDFFVVDTQGYVYYLSIILLLHSISIPPLLLFSRNNLHVRRIHIHKVHIHNNLISRYTKYLAERSFHKNAQYFSYRFPDFLTDGSTR